LRVLHLPPAKDPDDFLKGTRAPVKNYRALAEAKRRLWLDVGRSRGRWKARIWPAPTSSQQGRFGPVALLAKLAPGGAVRRPTTSAVAEKRLSARSGPASPRNSMEDLRRAR